MKRLALALAFCAVMAGGAYADPPPMQDAFGNTIVVTEPDGMVLRYHYNADNTFDLVTPSGQTLTGTYEVTGDQLCMTITGRDPACAPWVGQKHVGETWTQVGTHGQQISVTLAAGRP